MARRGSGIISVLISGDASPLNKSVNEASSSLETFGRKFGSAMGTLAAAGAAAVGAAAIAFGAYAKRGLEAAIETEAAQSRLATLLRNTGMATEDQIKGLNAQAAALGKVGVATGSNITVLQSQLATFDLSADAIRTLTPAIVDYVIAEKGAAATAGDFQSAANGLAQALQGNFGALSRVGFVLDDTTKNMIANGTEAERAAALVDVLSSTYGGFNEKALETAEGGLQALRNKFADVQETVGAALLPSLLEIGGVIADRMLPAFESFGRWFSDNEEEITKFVRDVLDRVITTVGDLISRFREWYQEHGPAIIDSFRRIADPVVLIWDNLTNIVGGIRDLIARFQSGSKDTSVFAALLQWIADTMLEILVFVGMVTTEIDLMIKKMNEMADSPGFASMRELVQMIRTIGDSWFGQGIKRAFAPAMVGDALVRALEFREAVRQVDAAVVGQRGNASRNNVNITVNGALNAEDTARQVLRALQDAERRTGVRLETIS
jgi:hypothetical protein